MILVRPVKFEESEAVQMQIYNHKSIIDALGGMTFLDGIKGKTKSTGPTIWAAFDGEKIVGSMMIGGRNQCHYAKFGEVGVLPEYRRQRIGTALYTAVVAQGVLEGRRIWEDTIVGTNEIQMHVLPTIGLEKWGILRKKTASFLDIHIFGYLLSVEQFNRTIKRLPKGISIELREDYYSADLWGKNMEIYVKKNPEFMREIETCREIVRTNKVFKVVQGEKVCVHNAGKKKKAGEVE